MKRALVLAVSLLLVSSVVQADTRLGRWKKVLDTDQEGFWQVTKDKRRTSITFNVSARHIRDDDVGQDIFMSCNIERLEEDGQWHYASGSLSFVRDRCSEALPVAVGTYRLHVTNGGVLSSLAEFTVDAVQGVTEN